MKLPVLIVAAYIYGGLGRGSYSPYVWDLPQACELFTVGSCDLSADSSYLIDTYPVPNTEGNGVSLCQTVCTSIQGCNYFTYDTPLESCYLLRSTYLSGCLESGGLASPSLDQCQPEVATTCSSFVRENCVMSGSQLSSSTVADAATCQTLVDPVGGKYFVYNTDTQVCLIYDSQEFTCSRMHGPDTPAYDTCGISQESSSASPSSTSSSVSRAVEV